jgi:hypothetical protein
MAIKTRETTADGVTNKGAPLTNAELDNNFVELQQNKLGSADLVAADTSYDNAGSGLVASNVQSAIDELQDKKLDISALAANVVFYPTTAASDISTYYKLVTSTDDADYDTVAVNVPTGEIDGGNVLVASLASSAGILSGSTGSISISTVGNVRVVNANDAASFYFEVYHRDSLGTETLIGTSGTTAEVTSQTYEEFFAFALIDATTFTDTDRVVLKFYANELGAGTGSFQFQFGGAQPVRSNFPVPVNVVSHANDAGDILVDTSNFAGALSGTDADVQSALDTLDDHNHDSAYQAILVEGAFVDGDKDKLDGIEAGATADQTGAEIKSLYEAESNTNAFTDAEKTKLGYVSVTQAVDLDQMETDIAALANGMVYKGDWDASTGSFPGSGAAQTGWFYYVSVGGTVGGVVFTAGDNVVAVTDNASTSIYSANWSKHDQTDAVQSVAGEVGSISASALRSAINVEDGATADQTAQEIATAIDADATAESTLKSALGLGTAAYTASTDYATAAQGALADSALQSSDIGVSVQGYSSVLAGATASFTTADESKLDGIEALADVTDTANVTAAGALMDSEVTNLAAVKAFDPTDYATAAQGALADSATQPGDNVSDLTNNAGYLTGITGQSIKNLSDVYSSMTPTDGQVLTYDTTNGWQAEDASASGGGITYVRKTANYTASTNEGVIADASGGTFTVTLPASPSIGDFVRIVDGADWSTTNLTVGRNGSFIEGDAEDMILDLSGVAVDFIYDGVMWHVYIQAGFVNDNPLQLVTTPTNVSPADSATDIGSTPALTGSAFASLYGFTMAAGQWQVSTVSDFSSTVVNTGDVAGTSVTYNVSSGILSTSTTYYWRVRYKNSHGDYSEWSTATSFTTAASFGPTVIGESYGGGYYAGIITQGGSDYYLIVAPKSTGENSSKQWKTSGSAGPSATQTLNNGPAASASMNSATYPAAQFCEGLSIGGYTDWYLPARDELELCYRNLKPTTDANNTSSRSLSGITYPEGNDVSGDTMGINRNSNPTGSAYTSGSPAQTSVTAFQTGNSEAFASASYWPSSEYSSTDAWRQYFLNGYQGTNLKYSSYYVRAVRRIAV